MIRHTLAVFLIAMAAMSAAATDARAETDGPELTVDRVLALGPLPMAADALGDSPKAGEMIRAMAMQTTRGGLPRAARKQDVFGRILTWQPLSPADFEEKEQVWLWTVQIEARRFVRGRLVIANLADPTLFVDGREVSAGDDGHELDLQNGTHTAIVVHHGRDDGAPELVWKGRKDHDRVEFHTEPSRRVSPELLTNAETVSDMALSADGSRLALAFDGREESADIAIRRLEIRHLESGRIERQWTGTRPDRIAWSPDDRFLAVAVGDNLWLHETDSGDARLLLANNENIGSWRWHPDSGSIVFAWNEKEENDNGKRRRLRALEDRWAGFRDNSQLHQVDIESGLVRALTSARRSITLQDIHPDGDRLLASERLIDYAEAPHSRFRIFELSLGDLEARDIVELRQFDAIRYADKGYWLLAGPGLSVGDGDVTGEDTEPNEYDTQLYRLSPSGEWASSLSREFDPAFTGLERLADGNLLLSVIDGERAGLVHFDAETGSLETIDTGVEVMESFVAADNNPDRVVVRGSDANAPQRVHRVDPSAGTEGAIVDTRPGEYADVRFGRVEPWSFVNDDGVEIEGRYYLPPDFDEEKDYPLIVYYYGGTMPVNRQFTGRYPFNLWAAHDYVIYVLQPRGAIGYGQDFSAKHVNAWGRHSADDIIEGTRRFVAEHDFVDGQRIGNIGASYGGFMTMYLATKTDLFAASISHAGISALTSYWGEGWWGYLYSGIASKGSFPWNNRELYVEHSPVYNADKITTPLLLLHGDSDTNVPPGESHNMYTALKLLDREVEMVEFPDEDHWILDREKRYEWWATILAWYDHHLKDEPEWWQHLYPETQGE